MKSSKLILFCLFSVMLFSCQEKQLTTLILTDAGKVQGIQENGFMSFKGIPFAAPPVGELRWKEPQPVKPWDGVLKADTFGPASPQAQNLRQSEDCLYLNVWTPAKYASEKLPVMFWIHGGGFTAGAPLEPTYFGEKLTQKGVIYISVTYRLGALGFLAHPELTAESANKASGNYGLLDMIAGLKWVQKNIAAFGGDPAKVTIFGESAGGAAVSVLCASPLAKGLFIGAICESGGNFAPVDERTTLKGAEASGLEFMKKMGASSLAELRKTDVKKFFETRGSFGFRPIVDNYVLTGDQYKLYEAGQYNDVNVIVGSNSDEGGMFVRQQIEPDAYIKGLRDRYGNFADQFLKLYPGSTKEEATYSSADMTRDSGFGWGSWTWGRLQSQTGKSKVFMYYFEQKQPAMPNMPFKLRGAPHAAEIKYVLQTIDNKRYGPDDIKLSETMATFWTNFAKKGDPNGENLPVWSAFSEQNPSYMYFNSNPASGPVPNLNNLKLFDEYYKFKRESK
jgi:para-nitrobenzyl esterase